MIITAIFMSCFELIINNGSLIKKQWEWIDTYPTVLKSPYYNSVVPCCIRPASEATVAMAGHLRAINMVVIVILSASFPTPP